MDKLKLLWAEPKVQFKGKGVITAWGEEMERQGWVLEREVDRWKECDLVFFGSDSQLRQEPLGEKPTILYFWGWMPSRLLDKTFQEFAQKQLQLMAQCTRILVPSSSVMDQLCDFGLPSQLCLPGVDSLTLDSVSAPPTKYPKLMFLSRLEPHKGLDILLQAVSLLTPPLEVMVCGPGGGGLREYYEGMAKELKVNARFCELEDRGKVMELKSSSLLVHPSLYEGFGLPPLEALYCGVPVICFDTPHMRWMLQEDAYYFSSVEGLAQEVVRILGGSYGEALGKAKHGQERIKKDLTLEQASQRLWAHVHQTIKEHLAVRIRQHPEEWAKIYDEEHHRNWNYSVDRFDPTWERHWRATALLALIKECKAEKILDVGCGAVYPTILARAGFTVHAVDISKECLHQVEAIAGKWGVLPKVTTHCEDAASLGFPDNTFDAVIQGELWEHVPDVERVISEGLRVLRPGGYLIATTPIAHHHWDPMHVREFDDDSIKGLLAKFFPVRVEVKKLEKIAEGEAEPSCYLVVLEKVKP